MKIGYARVSTKDQNLERQLDELTTAGCEKIFQEKISGTKRNRPEFDKMIDQLRQGDLVIVSELTRISRSTKDLVEIVELFKSKGVELKSIKEAWIDTTTAQGKLIFTFFDRAHCILPVYELQKSGKLHSIYTFFLQIHYKSNYFIL